MANEIFDESHYSEFEYKVVEKQYGSKTVASDSIKTISGWKYIPEGYTKTSPEVVNKYSASINHTPKAAGGADQIKNGGFKGKYNSSHAEKQLLTAKPNEPIGVSRNMCSDCKAFA